VRYTGFVVRDPEPAARIRRDGPVVVSAGGGLVGEPLLRAAIGAHRLRPVPMKLIAGPLLPDAAYARLEQEARGGPELVRSVPDLGAELAGAAASVSQGGYNTTLDLLQARVPALVVPFEDGREDEQRRRADRLAELGALRVLPAEQLHPHGLAAAVHELQGFRPGPLPLDLDGARASVEAIERLRARRTAERAV
jgi:predicted glycosyltransferase